jgi:hypothetical protein
MPLHIFLAFCILSIDFMIYAFLQWTYGDKRSVTSRKLAAYRNALKVQSHTPFLLPSREVRSAPQPRVVLSGGSPRAERQVVNHSAPNSVFSKLVGRGRGGNT